MTDILIEGGRALIDDMPAETSLAIAGQRIGSTAAASGHGRLSVNARGLLALPGIVDLHGDAFERQLMPRPRVDFPVDVALIDSDRQVIANGITTVFHAVTWSWEPGLRSGDNARKLLTAIEALRPRLAADTRLHLRQEAFNLDAEDEITEWLQARRIDLLAFNDHMDSTAEDLTRPQRRARMLERTGLPGEDFDTLVARVMSRAEHVSGSTARLARIARKAGIAMLSHDDSSPEQRYSFRSHGVRIAEFPTNEETAREAANGGDMIVFGAPNVVRGGSHIGWTRTADMVAKGLCSILASDYYYPSQLLAAFRLVADGICTLPQAWSLVSANPARAAGLTDRGTIAEGQRADLLLVDDAVPLRPRIVAVIAAGRLAYLADADRLSTGAAINRSLLAAS